MLILMSLLPVILIYLLPESKAGIVFSSVIVISQVFIPDAVPFLDEGLAVALTLNKLAKLGGVSTPGNKNTSSPTQVTDASKSKEDIWLSPPGERQ